MVGGAKSDTRPRDLSNLWLVGLVLSHDELEYRLTISLY